MQQIESVMVVRCELKIQSLGITVRHLSASLVMPNSYPDGIFNQTSQQLKILIFFSRETAQMGGWTDGWIRALPPFKQYFSHIRTMEG